MLATLIGVSATVGVAAWQISENRNAENVRAREALRLAAVSIVLEAPTCGSAEARARLAQAVLQSGILGPNFVERVRSVARPETFATWGTLTPNTLFKIPPSSKQRQAVKNWQDLLRENARKAQQARKVLCDDLAGR